VKYIYAFDLSLNCCGISIFDNDGTIVKILSIETKSEKEHSGKLKIIADHLKELKREYEPSKAIFEKGFSRFAASTQAIFKTVGLVQYLFYDVEQLFYSPASVKKVVGGRGNMKKEELQKIILKKYPSLRFDNFDQSDSVAVGLTYFIKNGVII